MPWHEQDSELKLDGIAGQPKECGGPVIIQLREDDFVAAMRSHHLLNALSRSRLLRIGLLLLFFMGLVAWNAGPTKALLLLAFATLWYFAVSLLLWGWTVPQRARRTFSQAKSLHESAQLTWDDEGFRVTNRWEDRLTAWAHLHRWHEDARSILLYQADALVCPLPKLALSPANLADLRARAAAAGVPGA